MNVTRRPIATVQNPYARKRPRSDNPGVQNHSQQQQQEQLVKKYPQTHSYQPQHQGPSSSSVSTASGHLFPSSYTYQGGTGISQNLVSTAANTSNTTGNHSSSSSSTAAPSSPPPHPHKNQTSSQNVSNKNNKRDSFEDPNFDWDAAIKVADTKVAQIKAKNNNHESNNHMKAQIHPEANSSVIDLTRPTAAKNSTTTTTNNIHSRNIMNDACNQSTAMKRQTQLPVHQENRKPPPGPSSRKPPTARPISSNGMASLRPSCWSSSDSSSNNSSASRGAGTPPVKTPQYSQQMLLSQQGKLLASPATTAATSCNAVDRIMMALPRELRFNLTQVRKPVQDSRLQELVKHANLSAPLNNGWKLYSHQKRAILRGLQMRRFILALDMGLGTFVIIFTCWYP